MISLQSSLAIKSETLEGVVYHVRVLSEIEKSKRDLALIDSFRRLGEAMDGRAECIETVDGEERQKPNCSGRLLELEKITEAIQYGEYWPAVIRTSLLSVEGIEINGKVPSVDDLIQFAPVDVLAEIVAACKQGEGLTAAERKN